MAGLSIRGKRLDELVTANEELTRRVEVLEKAVAHLLDKVDPKPKAPAKPAAPKS